MKIFVQAGVFHEEIYSRAFETLVDVMAGTRQELAHYRDIIEISERFQRDRNADDHTSRKQGLTSKTPSEASFVKEAKVSNPAIDSGLEIY